MLPACPAVKSTERMSYAGNQTEQRYAEGQEEAGQRWSEAGAEEGQQEL